MEQVSPGIYNVKLDDGSSVTLRYVSKSKELTGTRWTIDVRGYAELKNLSPKHNKLEIKLLII